MARPLVDVVLNLLDVRDWAIGGGMPTLIGAGVPKATPQVGQKATFSGH